MAGSGAGRGRFWAVEGTGPSNDEVCNSGGKALVKNKMLECCPGAINGDGKANTALLAKLNEGGLNGLKCGKLPAGLGSTPPGAGTES